MQELSWKEEKGKEMSDPVEIDHISFTTSFIDLVSTENSLAKKGTVFIPYFPPSVKPYLPPVYPYSTSISNYFRNSTYNIPLLLPTRGTIYLAARLDHLSLFTFSNWLVSQQASHRNRFPDCQETASFALSRLT